VLFAGKVKESSAVHAILVATAPINEVTCSNAVTSMLAG